MYSQLASPIDRNSDWYTKEEVPREHRLIHHLDEQQASEAVREQRWERGRRELQKIALCISAEKRSVCRLDLIFSSSVRQTTCRAIFDISLSKW